MGRKANNADVIFKPKPKIDAEELSNLQEEVMELESVDSEMYDIILEIIKNIKPLISSVEISNTKDLKHSREALVLLETKYKRDNYFLSNRAEKNVQQYLVAFHCHSLFQKRHAKKW